MPDQGVLCWRYDQWIESSIEALSYGDEILEPRTNQVIRFIDMEMGPSGDPILRVCPVDSEKNCGIDLTGYSLTPYPLHLYGAGYARDRTQSLQGR